MFYGREDLALDEIIRDQVSKCLRCQGNIHEIISHKYFIDNSQENKNKFYYCMSGKALFYFILRCSPQIEQMMMSKYLEKPLNTMMFVEYD